MKSSFEVEGLYNPSLRFAFTNILDEEFVSAWDSQPIIVKPHQTIELPHHLAVKLRRELVDKIILGKAKADEVEKNQPYYRSPIAANMGIPNARQVYEDQILRPLAVDEESPEMQVMRLQIRDELKRDMERKEGVADEPIPNSLEEFAQIKEGAKVEQAKEKKPLKVKQIKVV